MAEATAGELKDNPESRQRIKTAAFALPVLVLILVAIFLAEVNWSRDASFLMMMLFVTTVGVVFAYESLTLGSAAAWSRRQRLAIAVTIGLVPIVLATVVRPFGFAENPSGRADVLTRGLILIPVAVAPIIAMTICFILVRAQGDRDATRIALAVVFALYGVLAMASIPFSARLGVTGILPFAVVMLIVMVSDTAAYFVGRRWGKHKLAPRLSPKKTWEGFAAGIVSAGVALLILSSPWVLLFSFGGLENPEPPPFWLSFMLSSVVVVLLGALVGLIGTLGDLFASWFKRRVDAKDSGRLFPGHGGLLDRTDSLLPNFALVTVLSFAATRISIL